MPSFIVIALFIYSCLKNDLYEHNGCKVFFLIKTMVSSEFIACKKGGWEERETERERDRERERERPKERDRKRETERERPRERPREGEREKIYREIDREREKE